MAGAGNERTPATPGFGDLRASHADREYVISTLKAAFVQVAWPRRSSTSG